MKRIFTLVCTFLLLQNISFAQLTTPPDGGNRKAMVSERIGLTDITIQYHRPGVKGREGKIWGQLVPYGFTDLGFGTSKAAPWRAGANENTTIEFSTDVKVEGKDLPAGKYAFFIAVDKEESTIIFSKNNSSWGSYFYKPDEDALRVTIKQQAMDKAVEWLKYELINQTDNSATVVLEWEKWMFPFKVEVDLNKTQLETFRKELRTDKGFESKAWVQAVNWCADKNTNLDEALVWADYAISGVFVGEKNFKTLSAKSRILGLLGKTAEADAMMKEAAPLGSMTDVHTYARGLQGAKKFKEAAELFKMNYKKFPNTFTTNMGMMRALSTDGNYKEALKYANAALAQAPDAGNKTYVEGLIEKLKQGKDIN